MPIRYELQNHNAQLRSGVVQDGEVLALSAIGEITGNNAVIWGNEWRGRVEFTIPTPIGPTIRGESLLDRNDQPLVLYFGTIMLKCEFFLSEPEHSDDLASLE